MHLGRIGFCVALAGAVGMTFTRHPDFETRERVRIQAHFDSVLGELRSRDVSALSQTQRANRTQLVEVLAAYRQRGAFPHNYDRPGLVPTFVDPVTGVRCAVGHLIESTGRGDIVARVARADNHVLVAELAGDTAVRTWLDVNGLTLAEASRIQVPYMEGPSEAKIGSARVGDVPAVVLSVSSIGLTTWNLLQNRHRESPKIALIGMATGAFGVIAGNAMLANGRATPGMAKTAIWTGLASTVTGAVTLVLPVFGTDANKVQLSPSIAPADGKGGDRVGFNAALRF